MRLRLVLDRAPEPQQVLHRKDGDCEYFEDGQQATVFCPKRGDGLQNDRDHAGSDQGNQKDVDDPAETGVTLRGFQRAKYLLAQRYRWLIGLRCG